MAAAKAVCRLSEDKAAGISTRPHIQALAARFTDLERTLNACAQRTARERMQ